MKRIICHLLVICLSFTTLADDTVETAAATTNLFITSNTTNSLGLSRQALLDGGNGRVIDRSGKVVSHADAAAQMALATNLQKIATATANGVTNALKSLWAVTNQIPSHAEHIALYLPREKTPLNLTGEVIDEGSDGTTDWQIVRYSQYLAIAPNRHIEYCYYNTTATVECVWDKWDATALTHRCTFTRPVAFRGKLINSTRHETIGGAKGFDFGSALVTVDGEPTFTGEWTNRTTGAVYTFRNGVHLKQTKEANDE
jgi:hypothetical protein